LKIEAKDLPTLPFLDDSASLKQGQLILALDSPLGLDNSLSVGFVSAPKPSPRFRQTELLYIQTDTPINPGNRGVLDIAGRIAGINTMITSQSGGNEGIGFAIPSNVVQRTYLGLRQYGFIRRRAIGVVPQDITPSLASAPGIGSRFGVILSDIAPNSPAEAAGIEQGDIVPTADGTPIELSSQLMAAVRGIEIRLDCGRCGLRIERIPYGYARRLAQCAGP
jgi:serine protease Do